MCDGRSEALLTNSTWQEELSHDLRPGSTVASPRVTRRQLPSSVDMLDFMYRIR